MSHCRNKFQTQISKSYNDTKSIPLTQIHGRSLSWLGTDTSIKQVEVKLALMAQTSPLKK